MSDERLQDRFEAESELDGLLKQAVASVCGAPMPAHSLANVVERAVAIPDNQAVPLKRRSLFRYSLVASIAASLLIAVGIGLLAPRDSWAEVAKALRLKPWIHGIQTGPDGKKVEVWMSPEREVFGTRLGSDLVIFDDAKASVRNQYGLEEGSKDERVLYRIPLQPALAAGARQFESLFLSLMRGEAAANVAWPNAEVVKRERRTIVENGKSWTEFEFELRPASLDKTTRCIVRVDPQTNLPVSMKSSPIAGRNPGFDFAFDYPAENAGPVDIYDLGVPRTARVVDRLPSKTLATVVAAVRDGQRKFGSYFAIVAHTMAHNPEPWQAVRLDLVWRKGAKFRIETATLLREKRTEKPAADADMMKWWKEQLQHERAIFIPQRVCDGKEVWIAESKEKMVKPDDRFVESNWKRFGSVNDADEFNSFVGVVSTETMPDALAYFYLPEASQAHEVSLDEHPATGPAGCLLAESRYLRDDPHVYHLSRYWYDPQHTYLLRRLELSGLKSNEEGGAKTDSYEAETIEQTPSGIWYPTRVRRNYGPTPNDSYTLSYFVDFNAELPDSVFQPEARVETK